MKYLVFILLIYISLFPLMVKGERTASYYNGKIIVRASDFQTDTNTVNTVEIEYVIGSPIPGGSPGYIDHGVDIQVFFKENLYRDVEIVSHDFDTLGYCWKSLFLEKIEPGTHPKGGDIDSSYYLTSRVIDERLAGGGSEERAAILKRRDYLIARKRISFRFKKEGLKAMGIVATEIISLLSDWVDKGSAMISFKVGDKKLVYERIVNNLKMLEETKEAIEKARKYFSGDKKKSFPLSKKIFPDYVESVKRHSNMLRSDIPKGERIKEQMRIYESMREYYGADYDEISKDGFNARIEMSENTFALYDSIEQEYILLMENNRKIINKLNAKMDELEKK